MLDVPKNPPFMSHPWADASPSLLASFFTQRRKGFKFLLDVWVSLRISPEDLQVILLVWFLDLLTIGESWNSRFTIQSFKRKKNLSWQSSHTLHHSAGLPLSSQYWQRRWWEFFTWGSVSSQIQREHSTVLQRSDFELLIVIAAISHLATKSKVTHH